MFHVCETWWEDFGLFSSNNQVVLTMSYFLWTLALLLIANRAMTWSLTWSFMTSPRGRSDGASRGDIVMKKSGMTGDKLYLSNRMDIKIGLPTRDHDLAAKFIEDEKKLLDATWERGMYKVVDQKEKKYTLLFPPIGIPGIDTLSTSVEVEFQQTGGKISLRSNDWSIRGKNGVILRDSNFMESFQVEIMGELSIKEPAVIKASAIKADDLKVPAPPVVANGWVQYRVEGEKPNALKNAPPVVMDATVDLIKKISEDFATNQFKARFQSSFRSFLTSELSKQAVRKNIAAMKAKSEGKK